MLKSTDTMGIEAKKFIQKHEGGVVLAANEEHGLLVAPAHKNIFKHCRKKPHRF